VSEERKESVLERVGAGTTVKVGVGLGIALAAAGIGSLVVFRLMNRLKAEGLENIPAEHENVLYCLNHNSLLDNFAFESVAYLPKVLLKPEYLPVNLADRKNFFGDPTSSRFKDRVLRLLGKHFFAHLRAYPVLRGEANLDQVDVWAELLRHNIVVVFPEGTRSRTGEIGTGRMGVGKLIYAMRPTVIPVRMWGMEKVLGVGRLIPRALQTVHLRIGKAIDLTDLLDRPLPDNRTAEMDLYREISNCVVDAIRALAPPE
jgi:1-acyl-sn-glycerol-3-phosphate acyltransferase